LDLSLLLQKDVSFLQHPLETTAIGQELEAKKKFFTAQHEKDGKESKEVESQLMQQRRRRRVDGSLEERLASYKESNLKEEQRHKDEIARLEQEVFKRLEKSRGEDERRKDVRTILQQSFHRIRKKKETVLRAAATRADEDPQTCTICLDPLQSSHQPSRAKIMASTSCGHCFHSVCCSGWIESEQQKSEDDDEEEDEEQQPQCVRCPTCGVPSASWVELCLKSSSEVQNYKRRLNCRQKRRKPMMVSACAYC